MNPSSDDTELATSARIRDIRNKIPEEGYSFGEFIDMVLNEGTQLLVLLLSVPFLFPVSIPGSSTPFGLLIILLELSLLFQRSLFLPKFISNYELSQDFLLKIFDSFEKFMLRVEKIIKKRGNLTNSNNIVRINAVIIIILAFLLLLPLPVPLTDFVPASAIFLLTISTLEKDSYLMILSYLLSIIAVAYFISIGYVGIEAIKLIYNELIKHF